MMYTGRSGGLDFKNIYETIYPVLFRIAFRMTGIQEKAEDLCHEAFIKYYERPKPLPDLDQTKYWLIRVVKNISLNYEKKKSRERKAYKRFEKNIPQYTESSEMEVLREEAKGIVQNALNKLPHKLRIVIVLKEYSDLNYKEIGSILGISEGNVKIRVFRAREHLLQLLKKRL